MTKLTVFNKKIDKMLLEMEDDEGTLYNLHNGCSIKDMIYNNKGQLEKDFVKAIEDNNFNLDQLVIGHKRSDSDPFDLQSMFMCKDFCISVGYYSAGSSIAHAAIYTFKDKKYFDSKTGDFLEMDTVFSEENQGDISLF